MDVTYSDEPILVMGALEVKESEERSAEDQVEEVWYSSLSSHITSKFYEYRDSRRDTGVEETMFDSHKAYNRMYTASELEFMEPGGSRIYMPIITTKCRAAVSWIRDVLDPATEEIYSLESSPMPDLPSEIVAQIEEAFLAELQQGVTDLDKSEMPQEGQGNPSGARPVKSAAEKLRKAAKLKYNVEESIYESIKTEANHQLKKIERVIKDQMYEGGWDDAFAQFLQDFVVYPAAIMKGPVVTRENRIVYKNGKPDIESKIIFKNKRVSPLDFYPSPSSTNINDGDMIEHIRLSRSEVYALKGLRGYEDEYIDKILEYSAPNSFLLDSGLEDQKDDLELRDTTYSDETYHGLHAFVSVPIHMLKEWGSKDPEVLREVDEYKEVDVEAILINGEVVKCVLNRDPLGRKPYYKACWQNIPGSFWGLSLPELLFPVQRMCNATARALADNMGLSSGPMMEVYIDRLADSGAIDEIHMRQIWQMKSDPSGGTGRGITFFDVPSHAQELLAVYNAFEEKADDISGIPKYAYGNEKTAGAAQTAEGLSLLLEGASKGIRDAIRNIDINLIVPRIEYQFYLNVLTNPNLKYSGSVDVIAHGSKTLTMKAAQAKKRQEFLQITANPGDQEIMGFAARADILRLIAKDLGLPHSLIPSALEMQKKEEEIKAEKAQAAATASEKGSIGLQATQLQVEGQMQMHQGTLAIEEKKLALKEQELIQKAQTKMAEFKGKEQQALQLSQSALSSTAMKEDRQDARTNKKLAVDLQRTIIQSRDRNENLRARGI